MCSTFVQDSLIIKHIIQGNWKENRAFLSKVKESLIPEPPSKCTSTHVLSTLEETCNEISMQIRNFNNATATAFVELHCTHHVNWQIVSYTGTITGSIHPL